MNVLHGLNVGDSVKVTYNPMPYLGRGIQEPVVVEGILQEPKVNRGITYVVLKNAEGKCVLERNVMEIVTIEVAAAPEAFSVPQPEVKTARSYNRA